MPAELAAQLPEREADELRRRLQQQDAQALLLRNLVHSEDEPALPLSVEAVL